MAENKDSEDIVLRKHLPPLICSLTLHAQQKIYLSPVLITELGLYITPWVTYSHHTLEGRRDIMVTLLASVSLLESPASLLGSWTALSHTPTQSFPNKSDHVNRHGLCSKHWSPIRQSYPKSESPGQECRHRIFRELSNESHN